MIALADTIQLPLADKSVDLVFGSPPYCIAREYGGKIGAMRGCQEWIDWMLEVTAECLRVSRGAVIWVAAGVTRDRTYWPACEGLMYEWWKAGGSAYRPCYWHRDGIPGSGGDQHFRANVEYVMCFKRPGKLPWTDNTACGHPPKWAPGGEMSHRLTDGQRRNQWGHSGTGDSGARQASGKRGNARRPSHRQTKARLADGSMGTWDYVAPVKANPGNWIEFPIEVSCVVGGGHMGHALAHDNEAPFPEKLAERFVLSFCPPGGTILDPFSGSGTTKAVAEQHGRKGIAMDLRQSQCELTRRRCNHGQMMLVP